MEENLADRLGRAIRKPVIVLAYASFPVFILSYGAMLKSALQEWPLWASAPTVIAHVMVLVGVGFLFDIHQERQRSSEDLPRIRHLDP